MLARAGVAKQAGMRFKPETARADGISTDSTSAGADERRGLVARRARNAASAAGACDCARKRARSAGGSTSPTAAS